METSMWLEILRAGFAGLTLLLLYYTLKVQNQTIALSQSFTDRLVDIITRETEAKMEMKQSIDALRTTVENMPKSTSNKDHV